MKGSVVGMLVAAALARRLPPDSQPAAKFFFGLAVPEGLRARMVEVQEDLREADAEVRWSPPAGFHLTLLYLGEVPEGVLEALAEDMPGLAGGVEPFRMTVEGLGSFPPKGPPRVLWARPLEHGTPLRALAADLRRAARRHGLEPETKPFHPHLTLGRVKRLPPESDLPARLAAWKHTLVGVLPAPALLLYASDPGAPAGEYRVVGRWELGTALPE